MYSGVRTLCALDGGGGLELQLKNERVLLLCSGCVSVAGATNGSLATRNDKELLQIGIGNPRSDNARLSCGGGGETIKRQWNAEQSNLYLWELQGLIGVSGACGVGSSGLLNH